VLKNINADTNNIIITNYTGDNCNNFN